MSTACSASTVPAHSTMRRPGPQHPGASPAPATVERRVRTGARVGSRAPAGQAVGQQEADGHGQLVAHPVHVAPAVHPADQRRVPDVADDPGALGVVGGLGLPDGPGDDAVHDARPSAAGTRWRPGRARPARRRRPPPAGAGGPWPAAPGRARRGPAPRRSAPAAAPGPGEVELLHPVDEGGGQEVVLGREVAVDGAHGHVGPGGDVAHLDRLVATLEPELHGGVDDPLATRLLSTGQRPGKHPSAARPFTLLPAPARNGTRSTPGGLATGAGI